MPARTAVALVFLAFVVWFSACSSGLGNDPRRRRPQPGTSSSDNLPVGIDLGVIPTDPAAEPAVAGFTIPAYGSLPERDVVLLGFSTAAAADNGDGAGNPISRDATSDTNGASDVFVAAVSAVDIERRAFSQSLAGKFRHPRCTTCHSMQSATTQAFASSPLPHAGPPPGPTFPNNDPATCLPCHTNSTTFPVVGWQAPAASFDMRTETVAQLADRATRVPVGDTEHFVNDARVLWALDSGILPTVGGRNGIADDDHDGVFEPEDEDGVPRTVPGGSVNFIREIQDWNASGRVVTAAGAVRDVTLVSRANATTNAGNGASRRPRLLWVPNPSFNPVSPAVAAATNPVGTVYVVFESDANDLTAGDGNGATDVYRALVQVRVEEDATNTPTPGGINLVYLDGSTVLVSARNGTTTAGNGASSNPVIGGSNGQFVAFQSLATDLIAGFTDANGAGADVFLRRIGANTTQLVSHTVGDAATGGNGASERPAIDATASGIAFESDASDLIASDLNGLRDVFHTLVGAGSPFTKVRSSVGNAGAEAAGGASSAASIHVDGSSRVRVAFQSDATNLAPSLTAATNVFLFDSATGFSTLLNQRVASTGDAVGNGSATSPSLATDGSRVVFASAADNIDVLRSSDGNRSTDIFLVELAQLDAGNVLPFRVSMTTAEAADANGSSSGPALGSFPASGSHPAGFLAYTTAATNLGAPDSTRLIVSFLSETSGVFADFTATPVRGAGPLTVQFTDASSGQPTSWQWDFENDGTVDATVQNPTHTYTTPGTYTVKLVAANANTSGEKTATDFVLVVGTIDADFTASVQSGVAPLSVTFTDTSTQSPTSWQWDFDDDGIVDSTDQNPTHVYATPGTYTVKLVATNEVGPVTETKTGFITVFAPVVAGFTRSPTNGVAPLNVNFTNTSTGATSYAWDFDEDSIVDSTAANPSFNYPSAGTFDVTLVATGPGGTDTFTFANCVTVFGAVTANFTMTVGGNPITSAYEATNITFTSTSTGTISTTTWDFDFVGSPGTLTASGSPVVRNFANTTASTRTFVVRLSVSGPGGSATLNRNLTIVSDTETASFSPIADNTIYQELTNNNNGAGTGMVAGRTLGTAGSLARRAMVRFNVGAIPSSSTIVSASMDLTSDTTTATGAQSIGIHRITSNWTEGTSSGTAGVGAAATGGGATWANRITPSTAWGTAGGDFIAGATATIAVNTSATYTSGSLASDVQLWVNGTNNFGWLLKGNEAVTGTVKRFLTREAGAGAPVLNVTYTRPLP